jgi:hypothetical protein
MLVDCEAWAVLGRAATPPVDPFTGVRAFAFGINDFQLPPLSEPTTTIQHLL